MAKAYPPPSNTFTFKGFMAPVHCIMVNGNILFTGTQEGKVHLWNLKSFRELFSVTASTQPILSLHRASDYIIIQDKELTVSLWKYDGEESSEVSFKEVTSLKRSEPKLSFCKCIVFKSDLENNFNKFGNIRDSKATVSSCLENNQSLNSNSYYIVVPYDSKEITVFSLESRKKLTVIDVVKDSSNKISDVIMCIKYIQIDTNVYLILCTEEGYLTLYNLKRKSIECQVNLKSHIKATRKHPVEDEDLNTEQGLDMNMPDVPMAIDFDIDTMRGLVGTNSKNLYCIKLYPENSSEKAGLKIKMVLQLKHSGVSSIAIKPDKKLFVLSFWDGNGIYIYKWNTMKCISFIDYVYSTIHDLYFFNSNMLAVACDGGKVALWKFHDS